MNYEIHNTYPLVAEGIIEGQNEKKYITLRRPGEEKISQFAPAYDFQTEWVDKFPCKIWCEVIDYDAERDICVLQQCYYDLLANLYTGLPQTNKFKVIDSKIDGNTNNHFYILKDAYGLCHRRYADNGTYSIGDEVELLVESVVERGNRHGYLSLAIPNVKPSVEAKSETTDNQENEDPRGSTTFGQENDYTEFKSSIIFTPADINPKIDEQIKTIMKTIAGFMNKDGGTLYLGVNDAGMVCGIESDFKYLNTSETDKYKYHQNQDGYELKIRESIKQHLTNASLGNLVTLEFKQEGDKTYCVVTVKQSKYPVFYNGTKLYQRMGNQTNMLKDFEVYLFIHDRIAQFNMQTQPANPEDVTTNGYGDEVGDSVVNPTKEQSEEEQMADEAAKITITRPVLTPWRYVRLYADGGWSYDTKDTPAEPNPVHEIVLPQEKKAANDNRLIMVYKNGCVDAIMLNDLRPKQYDHKYANGWLPSEGLLTAFVANNHEAIAFRSHTKDGEQWNKIHYATAVTAHPKMGNKGNKVVNELKNATIDSAVIVPKEFEDRLSSYRLADSQTSQYLGFKRSDPSFRDSLHLLDAIFDM